MIIDTKATEQYIQEQSIILGGKELLKSESTDDYSQSCTLQWAFLFPQNKFQHFLVSILVTCRSVSVR